MKITSHYLLQNNEQYANEPALSFKDSNGEINTDTWSNYYEFVMSISKSLKPVFLFFPTLQSGVVRV